MAHANWCLEILRMPEDLGCLKGLSANIKKIENCPWQKSLLKLLNKFVGCREGLR